MKKFSLGVLMGAALGISVAFADDELYDMNIFNPLKISRYDIAKFEQLKKKLELNKEKLYIKE